MKITGGAATWPSRWPRWLLIAMHLPIMALTVVFSLVGDNGPAVGGWQRVPFLVVAAAILSIQLRHSLAAARGTRPAGWQWTLLLLTVLVEATLLWVTPANWIAPQTFVVASSLMLFRGWLRLLFVPPFVVGNLLGAITVTRLSYARGQVLFIFVGGGLWYLAIGVALFAAARLVRVLGELHATRAELADAAIGRERLRVSRDLHDLLGQSLSAISLKGDLAVRLLATDPPAARAEIHSLTGLARTALRGVHAIARDEPQVSLAAEADGAAAVLAAAGVDVHIAMDPPSISAAAEQMLAWALREGATNVLRHSEACTCTIAVAGDGANVRLEVVNDRAHPPAEGGTGLAGLTERARALAGSVTVNATSDGGFRLLVLIPREAT